MSNTLKLGNGKWATGKDTLLSFSDTNNNYKPLPFSFSRASSGTVVNKDGLIETVGSGEPRIDFKDNAKGALLLEPQRTNYVLKSNDFSLLSGGFVTPNYGTSPEGLSVSRILFTDANQSMSSGTSLSTGVVCNFSAYVKGIKGQFIKFAAGGVDIAHTFSGEWERLSGSATSINNSWNLNTYGYATARDFLLCGVQLEEGSYATSYIPTSGSAVTRNQDFSLQGGFQSKNIFGSNQGTAVFDIKWDEINYIFDFADAGGTKIRIYNDNNTQWRIRDMVGASWYFTGFNITQGQRTKIGFKWSGTEIIAFQNGVKSSINGTLGSNVSVESITTNKLNNISNMQFYNTALTDQELIALTS